MKVYKNTDHSGASQTNRRPSIEKEASTNNAKPRYLRYEPDGKTPLKFIQPDEYDGVDRHLNGNQENVQYVGNSHIRIWYNTQTEGYMPHHHAAIEIISTVEGDYTVSCNNQVYHLHQGDLLIIPPHMVHRLMGSPSGARFITLFDVSPISDFVDFKVISARFVRPVYISAAKEPVLHHQMTEGLVRSAELYFAHETMWEMMIYAEILKLYGFIGKAYLSNPDNFSSKDHPHIQRNYDKFDNLLSYLEEHVADRITLDDAAEYAGYSKFHFSRLFKEYTGITYYEHIQNIRIRTAQELLATETSITEIAYRTGFHDLTSFSRAFRNATGMTPTKYRSLTATN